MNKATREAIEKMGRTTIAEYFGISHWAVCKWVKNGIPIKRIKRFEVLSGVARDKLRPDIYR